MLPPLPAPGSGFKGNTNTGTNETIHDISQMMRPNLRYAGAGQGGNTGYVPPCGCVRACGAARIPSGWACAARVNAHSRTHAHSRIPLWLACIGRVVVQPCLCTCSGGLFRARQKVHHITPSPLLPSRLPRHPHTRNSMRHGKGANNAEDGGPGGAPGARRQRQRRFSAASGMWKDVNTGQAMNPAGTAVTATAHVEYAEAPEMDTSEQLKVRSGTVVGGGNAVVRTYVRRVGRERLSNGQGCCREEDGDHAVEDGAWARGEDCTAARGSVVQEKA